MSLIEKLTPEDKSSIEYYIRNYARNEEFYSGSLCLDTSLEFWNRDKTALYQLLDNHLIIEKEIEFEKSMNQKEQEMSDSGLSYGRFIDRIKQALADQVKAESKAECWWRTYPEWYTSLIPCLTPRGLARNSYDGEKRISFTLKDFNDQEQKVVIQPGEKLIRVLHKLAKILHIEEEYEEFRIKHSMVLNQQTYHGTLSLSIHPIDFMTMSDNTYSWTSCMSWQDNGCYREGTLECMNSPYVVVGYLKGSEPFKEGGHEFPNKKWRELFIVHEDIIMGVKGYPYTSDDLEKACVNWLRDLAIKNWSWEFPEAEPAPADANECNTWHYAGETYVRHFDFDFMYNDTFSDRTIHYAHFPKDCDTNSTYISLDACVRCIICGDYLDSDDCDGGMGIVCCESCNGVLRCSCCGERLRSHEVSYTLNDEPLCEYCWDSHAVYSKIADDYYYDDDMTSIYLIPRDLEPKTYTEFYNYPSTDLPNSWLYDKLSVPGIHTHEIHSIKFDSWPWHTTYFIYEDEVDEDYVDDYWGR